MSQQRHIQSDIKYQLLLSFAGLLLIIALTLFPPTVTENVSSRKTIIGSIFSILCILGILAIVSPNQCGKILSNKKKTVVSDSAKPMSQETANVLQGHHPTCGKYSAHTFKIKNRTFCAACIGLLFGGLLALAGAWVYFFGDWHVAEHSTLLVLLGSFGVGFGLFQFKFKNLIRLIVNTFFVLGAMLILIGIDESVHSLIFDLFVFSLIVFWLYTRISLSRWDHEIICSKCETKNCEFREQKKEGF